jgi:hypothetical protein
MKDHIREKKPIDLYGSLESVILSMREKAEGLVDPVVDVEYHGYDGYSEYFIFGWRPMNEKELEQAKARRAAEKATKKAAKEKKEAEERAEYERLKEKYGE